MFIVLLLLLVVVHWVEKLYLGCYLEFCLLPAAHIIAVYN